MFKFLILLTSLININAQYGPDPPNVPKEFMCAWRQLAYNRSIALRPDIAKEVLNALQLSKFCPVTDLPNIPPHTTKTTEIKTTDVGKTIYVDGDHGSDTNSGISPSLAKKSIQAAVDVSKKDVISIKAGTYYLSKPIELSATTGSHLTITSNGGTVWLSGGVPVSKDLSWTHVSGRIWSLNVSTLNLPDVATVRLDGRRINPARYPNADPEREFWPVGYTTSKENFVNKKGDWLLPTVSPSPNSATPVNVTGRPWDNYFTNYTGGINGTCAIYDPPFSYWCSSPPFSTGCGGCFTWNIPSGLETRTFLTSRPNWPYTKSTDVMQLAAWRKAHWANWLFEVNEMNNKTGTIKFGKGGFQGARGGPGSDWFVQNVYEELDRPDEFFYNIKEQTLYMYSNTTDPKLPPTWTNTLVLVPLSHHTLLTTTTTGSRAASAAIASNTVITNLTLSNLNFRDTASTMLQPHGVPSGGDWALERMAAVYMESTKYLTVDNCLFSRIGGNALMLSKYNQHASITNSHFAWLGGTAVALWGWTDELLDNGIHGVDGTTGDFPRSTLIEFNIFREIGIWEKQSSAVFQAKSAESILRHNVVFNLGRAGFNFNDGFGGGDIVEDNVLFHTCRESSDHGPINSWDRQPFITTIRTGKPDAQMAWRQVRRNFVVANYGGSKEIDNDDGSLFYNLTNNVMVYGWGQKFKCGGIRSVGNLKMYIDLGGKFNAGCLLQEDEKIALVKANRFFPNVWHNDTMISLQKTGKFAYRSCWGTGPNGEDFDQTQVHDNMIYIQNDNVGVEISNMGGTCAGKKKKSYTLAEFQQMGEDPGTIVKIGWPSISLLMVQANEILSDSVRLKKQVA